jgi:hypothetical protein
MFKNICEMFATVMVTATLVDVTCRELHVSSAARVTIAEVGPGLSHLRLTALADETIDNDTLQQILGLTDELLDKGEHFQSTWDLRLCQVPGMMVVARCVRWALSRKRKLDACNQRMAICMPDKPALLAVVRVVLKVFGPICPVLVSKDETECDTFMN